jgi:hypothetical protein
MSHAEKKSDGRPSAAPSRRGNLKRAGLRAEAGNSPKDGRIRQIPRRRKHKNTFQGEKNAVK